MEPKLLSATVRDGEDEWHIECRFDDGQKYAAVLVDRPFEGLADTICALLNNHTDWRKEAERLAEALDDIRRHANFRITDGEEIGANVWRLALGDVAHAATDALSHFQALKEKAGD